MRLVAVPIYHHIYKIKSISGLMKSKIRLLITIEKLSKRFIVIDIKDMSLSTTSSTH